MTSSQRRPSTKISALVSDVDGTLVTDDKILTTGAKDAVAELRARGIVFSIVSSRPPRGMSTLIEPLGITAPIAGFNGGLLTTPELAIITEHLLPREIACRAVTMLEAKAVQVWVFSGQDWFVRDRDGPYIEHEERAVKFLPTIVGDFVNVLGTAAKIVGVSKNFDLLTLCERDVRTALTGQASVVRSQLYYLDITHPLANKGVALAEVARLIGIPLDEIAVIGDGGNDVAMFERSGLSIAMGNASAEVRRAADFVTCSNRDNGFAKAVEQFILCNNFERTG